MAVSYMKNGLGCMCAWLGRSNIRYCHVGVTQEHPLEQPRPSVRALLRGEKFIIAVAGAPPSPRALSS